MKNPRVELSLEDSLEETGWSISLKILYVTRTENTNESDNKKILIEKYSPFDHIVKE